MKLVGPLNEPLHVRRVGVSAVVLSPCKLAGQQALIHRRHLSGAKITLDIKPLCAQQSEDAARIHGGHKAAFMIEPVRIALGRDRHN
jgi:hypothetical protein